MSSRNPKKIVEAASAVGVMVAGLKLREVTASVMVILQRIESPLMKPREPGAEIALSDWDVVRMLYAFTHPAATCYAALEGGDYDVKALAFADEVPFGQLPAIGAAIGKLIERAFETILAQKKTANGPTSSAPTTTGGC
jgi:hypothetical protein